MTQTQTGRLQLWRFLVFSGLIFSPHSATAQRVPIADDTLGDERSVVSPDQVIRDLPSNRIDGGARRGANLFHSFREFNVDAGRGAYFSNPDGVANILTRVTGNNRSDILGTLGVLGNANLFLLNPNGVVFGKNSRLDVGGSFISSTADSFVFDQGFAFSATDPQAPPLLTVSAPIGLQYGSNPGAIRVQEANLEMPDGQTLILAGGTVNIDGVEGIPLSERGLYALGGRVELAGIAAGEVGLRQQGQEWRLSVPAGLARADVTIDNAIVDVRAGGGGSVAITARNLTIRGVGTRVRAGIAENLGAIDAQAGDIIIHTAEVVNIDESVVNNVVLEGGIGNAGDIRITTGSLSLLNGAGVDSSTEGQGSAGNITITARDAVVIDGQNRIGFPGGIGSGVQTIQSVAIGQGGDIRVTTGSFTLSNLGSLQTVTGGQGDAGNIIITARDSVFVDGTSRVRFVVPSGIYTSVIEQSSGEGGKIRITAGSLAFTNGGRIDASVLGQGNAGNITITARDAVSFEGVDIDGWPGGVFSTLEAEAVGQGGRIQVNSDRFSIRNGAELSAASEGQGRAGSLEVTARQLRLDQGSILTETASGRGGDITLQVEDGLLLRNRSRISTTAGTAQAGGDGGNITIDGNFIAAVENENSDISANAFTGRGGNVQITTQGIFGIEARPQPTAQSDITASSERGVAGIVAINTPDADPSRGLVQLPVELSDASQLIAQACPTGDTTNGQPNQFIVTGRGGLPPTPSEAVNQDAIQVDLVTVEAEPLAQNQPEPSPPSSPSPDTPLTEAQGWQVAADGSITLVAVAPKISTDQLSNQRLQCQ